MVNELTNVDASTENAFAFEKQYFLASGKSWDAQSTIQFWFLLDCPKLSWLLWEKLYRIKLDLKKENFIYNLDFASNRRQHWFTFVVFKYVFI